MQCVGLLLAHCREGQMAQRVRNWRKLTVGAPAYQASPPGQHGTCWPRTCAGCAPGAGLSREALVHECGINRTYLSGVERSERNLSIDSIARTTWRLLKDG